MKTKKIESKLKLNKTTIARLTGLGMSAALGGICPPPSIGDDATCANTLCDKCTWTEEKGGDTAG